MYKLFYSPGACSTAVHIILEEIGVPFDLEEVSVKKGRTASAEYLSINPKGRVPALLSGNTLLTEGPAISIFLASTHPTASLLPLDPLDHFRCLEWLNWLTGTVHAVAFGQLWRPQRFIDDPARYQDVSAKGRENVLEAYAHIDRQLTRYSWSIGEDYTVVDPWLLVFYMWGNLIGVKMRKTFPAWSLHTDRVVERPAVQRVLQREGLPAWVCVKPISSTLARITGKLTI